MGRLSQCTAGLQIFLFSRVVPIRKVGNEIEERTAEFFGVVKPFWVLPGRFKALAAFGAKQGLTLMGCPFEHKLAGFVAKDERTEWVCRIWPECRADYCPACSK